MTADNTAIREIAGGHRPPLQYLLPDFRIFREPARFQLRKNQLSIHAHFKTAAIGRYKDEFFKLTLEFGNKFFGQTDRFRLVVSDGAINNPDIHSSIFLALRLP